MWHNGIVLKDKHPFILFKHNADSTEQTAIFRKQRRPPPGAVCYWEGPAACASPFTTRPMITG